MAFVFDQLGCPYSYGSTGPCSVGFDCSGLVMSAWAAAGITIPRDTYEQWAALPHISESAIQPGDLLYYNGIGHVAMYVGGGMIIDAPTAGPARARAPDEHRLVRGQLRRRRRPVVTRPMAKTAIVSGARPRPSPGGTVFRHRGLPPPITPGPRSPRCPAAQDDVMSP